MRMSDAACEENDCIGKTIVYYHKTFKPGQPVTRPHESDDIEQLAVDVGQFLNPVDALYVREEYKDIFKWIVHRRENRLALPEYSKTLRAMSQALVLFGQPGMGKSTWLNYALAMSLEKSWPVVVEFAGRSFYLYRDEAVDLTEIPYRKWRLEKYPIVLIDFTTELGVLDRWSVGPPSFLVVASSPDAMDFTRFRKHRPGQKWFWTTSIWSLDEMERLENIMTQWERKGKEDRNDWSLQESVQLFGPCPRTFMDVPCQRSHHGLDHDLREIEACMIAVLDGLTPTELRAWEGLARGFLTTIPAEYQRSGFHRFFFIHPEDPQPAPTWPRYTFKLASAFTKAVFTHYVVRKALTEHKLHASRFMPVPAVSSHQFDGYGWAHLMCAEQPTEVHMPTYFSAGAFDIPPLLTSSLHTFRSTAFDKTIERPRPTLPHADLLYSARLGQQTFDAVATIAARSQDEKMTVVLLQATIANAHSFDTKGILEVMYAFGEDAVDEHGSVMDFTTSSLKNTYVGAFVSFEDDQAKKLVSPYDKREGVKIGRAGYQLPIGYMVVPRDSPLQPLNLCAIVQGPTDPPTGQLHDFSKQDVKSDTPRTGSTQKSLECPNCHHRWSDAAEVGCEGSETEGMAGGVKRKAEEGLVDQAPRAKRSLRDDA